MSDIKELQLTKGKIALVDAADYQRLSQWKWFAYSKKDRWYAARVADYGIGQQRKVAMHRLILGVSSDTPIKHIDGDGLNNCRANLLPVRRQQIEQPDDPSIRHISLSRGRFAVVDAADYDWLNQWNWFAQYHKAEDRWYAVRMVRVGPEKKRCMLLMHRVILDAHLGFHVDHRDGDGLNNKRSNLREATCSQNGFNRGKERGNMSGFKGVSWNRRAGKWQVFITANKRKHYLGLFADLEPAAAAYREAAKRLHGEFARVA